ncbi:UDP-glycosyltransferase TURAN [Vanrija pseudolonga]|uniref:Chitobiosyldiphosphodolichol beta-mannosyltransferase n=1 Tax=Vanrija pseudolonga TaxID=143232 RepID=A0AAF0Y5T5_9TREE|nr:UDP-glycosyltransferase TURAN [Vanrija pseudolonga]
MENAIFKGDNNPNAIPVWGVFAIFAALIVPPMTLFVLFAHRIETRPSRHRTATLLVLGDIGRSPRMMYHAESLAKAGWDTYVIGYGDTTPIPALLETPLVHLLHLANPPKPLLALPWILRAPIRIVYQVISVIYLAIFKVPCNTQILLVQNPPSIPTLLLAQLICGTTRSRLIIDWHNTGYSILAMRLGEKSPLVRIAKWFERTFGQDAYCHLFVTRALEEFLVKEWHLRGRTAVLHDRPPAQFRRTEMINRLELFKRITPEVQPPLPDFINTKDIKKTAFTELTPSGTVELRPDRPAFLVSSTSWTADEDFSLLLKALDIYQKAKTAGAKKLPVVVMVITGKGALRKQFEAEVAKRENSGAWPDVVVRCQFVSAKDYPILLGSTDLGVSMHQSSSGRDLPMKVVDMFGCGVPVLARGFACIDELVKDGRNGRIFNTAEELGEQLIDTLENFPEADKLNHLSSFFEAAAKPKAGSRLSRSSPDGGETEWSTWDQNWDVVMKRNVLEFKK